LKSLAHPDWPYAGTPHEWRGFVKKAESAPSDKRYDWHEIAYEIPIYQKQNFGPDLT
jgi:hypothetical protein